MLLLAGVVSAFAVGGDDDGDGRAAVTTLAPQPDTTLAEPTTVPVGPTTTAVTGAEPGPGAEPEAAPTTVPQNGLAIGGVGRQADGADEIAATGGHPLLLPALALLVAAALVRRLAGAGSGGHPPGRR